MVSASQPESDTTSTRTGAISTPFWDGLLSGGLAIVGMSAVLVYLLVFGGEVRFTESDWIALALLVNSPHFMASYRVLYVSRESLRAHPWATVVVPLLLIGTVVACVSVDRPAPILRILVLVSSIYLAWHYAGQTWGMVASFSHLAGVRYTDRERALLRFGPRCLIALHVLFALQGRLPPSRWIDSQRYVELYTSSFYLVGAAILTSVGLGVWGFASARRRGQPVPIRAVLPWVSLYLWYPFWYFVPGGFMWIQLAHALQYLAFPIRVEVNRYAARGRRLGTPTTASQRRLRAALSYLGFVALGMLVLHGPPLVTRAIGEGWWSAPGMRLGLTALTHCVGIHHYFVDGAIWHLRNAAVRDELFRHVRA